MIYKTVIILPDGTELKSGINSQYPILSTAIMESVNESQELAIGSTCANKLEAKIRITDGSSLFSAGQEISAYKEDTNGVRRLVGMFTLEKPVRVSANTVSITAYDRISWLDKDLSGWIKDYQFPDSLYLFANNVCQACGLSLHNESIPNGDHYVNAFSGNGITGRQLIRWVGQAAGSFARATPDGQLEFAWYEDIQKTITPNGDLFYYQNGLNYSDYQTMPIEKVQIQQTDNDVGVIWPDELGEKNTYKITGNYLLTAEKTEDLAPVAQTIYEQIQNVSYTPCKIETPVDLDVRPGSIVHVIDRNGKEITAYVMNRTVSGQRMTLECTGSYRRDSVSVVNETSFRALSGKVMDLKIGVEGIKAENRDTAGKVASLALNVDNINATVQMHEIRLKEEETERTQVEQTAEAVKIAVERIQSDGVTKLKTGKGYTFDDSGLHIQDSNSDIRNTLDHTGMYVKRNNEIMLQANNSGVIATDVTVNNYLSIANARFELYDDGTGAKRTACFFSGGN